jgi:hypothetical protein
MKSKPTDVVKLDLIDQFSLRIQQSQEKFDNFLGLLRNSIDYPPEL